MAILTKGQTFANGDSITSTKLNNLVDNSAFVSGASGTTDDSTLEVNGSGRLQVKDLGVTAAKLASSAVTTAKIASATGASDGVTYAKLQHVANMRVIGNVSGALAAPTEVSILDEDTMSSDSATAIPTQQSTKAYVDTEITAATSALLTYGTETATTSGTTIDFTGIPSGTKRITVMLVGVSTNGTSNLLLRLGDSGGVENTGYISTTGTDSGNSSATTSFEIGTTGAAGSVYSGMVILTRLTASSNTWAASSIIGRHNNGQTFYCAGYKDTSGTLDRIQLTTTSADTFDAGSMNIMYE